MKLFSEKVNPTLTNSSFNILQVEDFEEIFFGVYEIEINKSKYPVEVVSEYNGNPVVSVPVEVKGEKKHFPFILIKGKPEVIFNENNTIDKIVKDFEELPTLLVEDVEIDTPVIYDESESINIPALVDNKKQILEQIAQAKKEAVAFASKIKKKKINEANLEIASRKNSLNEMIVDARSSLVNEFVNISNKIKSEFISENDNRFDEIKDTIDNKIQDLSDSLYESLKNDFSNSEKQFDSKIKELITELYKSLQPKIDNDLKEIATEIVEKVDSIEKNLDAKLKDKVDKKLFENVENELNSITNSNVELNDKINKGVNKALSRVGNIDRKVDELTIAISEEVETKITNAEEHITNYYKDKLDALENKTFDLNESTRKYFIDLITESRNNLISEIRLIKNEKPIEYIVESKGKKNSINSDDLVKEFDKKISSKIDTEVTRLRKYIAVYSGGGSVAMQFADGGTMNGNLTVLGAISASQYLGIPYPSENDTLDIVTSRGNVTNNSISVATLSADSIISSGIVESSRFVTTNGLSSQFVKGDGTLDSTEYLTAEDLNSNIILYPTTTSSGISDYSLMVSSITDIAYDDPAVNVPTGDIDSIDTYISTIISREGLIIGDIDTINMTVIGKIRKTSGGANKNASFHFHVYKRSADGTETPVGVSGDTLTVTSSIYEEYSASVLLPANTWLSTDRLVLKLYGILIGSGGGSSPQYEFEFGGETPVRVLIPLPTSVQLSNYVPYIGATKDIDLGIHNITANNIVYTSGAQTIGGNKTFAGNIVSIGGANSFPYEVGFSPFSVLTQRQLMAGGHKFRQAVNVNSKTVSPTNAANTNAGQFQVLGMKTSVAPLTGNSSAAFTLDNLFVTDVSTSVLPIANDIDIFLHGVGLQFQASTSWVARINFGVAFDRVVPLAGQIPSIDKRQWGIEFYYSGADNIFYGRLYYYFGSLVFGDPFVLPIYSNALPTAWQGFVYSIRMSQVFLGSNRLRLEFYINESASNNGGSALDVNPLAILTTPTILAPNFRFDGKHINFEVATNPLTAPVNITRMQASNMFCQFK